MAGITREEFIEYIHNPFSSWNREAREEKGHQESQKIGESNG